MHDDGGADWWIVQTAEKPPDARSVKGLDTQQKPVPATSGAGTLCVFRTIALKSARDAGLNR